jgi:hypothetical protein
MGRALPVRRNPIARAITATFGCALVAVVSAQSIWAQVPPSVPAAGSDAERIARLEGMVSTVVEENRRLAEEVRMLKEQLAAGTPPVPAAMLPDVAAIGGVVPTPTTPSLAPAAVPSAFSPGPESSPLVPRGRFRVDYERGFAILPENVDDTPFSLRVRSQNMFRYNGFVAEERFWINSAGERIRIGNNNYFAIPRGRLIFSGTALLPRLTYLLNIDYNTISSNPIGFRAYELGYRFSRAFELYVGQTKVPGTREWIESAFVPLQSADRTMATTFFRPSLSQGVWVSGQPRDDFYYTAMISNGFNTLNLLPERLNNRFAYSGSVWWEPWGDFGRGYSDLQHHEEAALRLGGCYTLALGRGSQSASDAVENSPIRLSDGTIITTPGALAPGVTLQTYDVSLATIDLSYKYRGLGLSTEFFFQDLLGLEGNGPLPIRTTSAFGAFVKGGYFVIPQRAELFARASFVTGAYGSGSEVGGGLNYFFLKGQDNMFFTLDATGLESSPAGQARTGFVAGQTGFLFRTQVTVVY